MNAVAIFEKQLAPLAPRFAQVLPANVSPDRLIRTVVVSVERLPKLLDCDRQSLFNAAMSAAILGLEVDGVTGQAYLIPFKGKAQLVVGYKGYNTIAARSGITITGAVVREGDAFEFDLGEGWVTHKPALDSKGRIVAAWAKASHASRPPVVTVMGIADLLAVKAKSPGAARSDSPWNDTAIGFPAMCEKTVKRRLSRSLPLNMMQAAARMDEAVDEQGKPARIDPDRGVVIDGEILQPSETPTAAQLIGSTSGDAEREPKAPSAPAADQPAAAQMEPRAAAGAVPEWQDYCNRWDMVLEEATDAQKLGEMWNGDAHKKQRRAIEWPPGELEALKSRVESVLAELKKAPVT
jgi:recombination protein RecT